MKWLLKRTDKQWSIALLLCAALMFAVSINGFIKAVAAKETINNCRRVS